MSLTLVFGVVAAAVGAAVGIGRRLTERSRVRRRLRSIGVLAPGSAEGEHVQLTGTVRVFERTLTSPLSATSCVAYRARARVTSRAHRQGTAPVSPSTSPESLLLAPFLLEGPAGAVLVDGEHAVFDLSPTRLTSEHRERMASFLTFHGFTPLHSARFKEVVLAPGMQVTIAGVMMRDVALEPALGDRAFREASPPLVRLTGNREHPLLIGRAVRALAAPTDR